MSEPVEPEVVAWLRKEVGDDLAYARACLARPIWGTDFEAINERIADCEAKLAILDEHAPTGWKAYGEYMCSRCFYHDDEPPPGEDNHWVPYPCRTVLLVAAGYKYRDGYLDSWKPS